MISAIQTQRARLREAGLTPLQTWALALHVWDGLSYSQIAERLGITPQAAGKHVRAARRKLRRAGLDLRPPRDQPIEVVHADIDRLSPTCIRGVA